MKKRVFLASLKEIDVANIGPAGPIKLVRILNRSDKHGYRSELGVRFTPRSEH
jgi:hypothetical protein